MVSALFGFLGALLGGLLSYWGSKSAAFINIDAQNRIIEENKRMEKIRQEEALKTNAKLIYLDIITAISEGFKVIKKPVGRAPGLLPMNLNYTDAIVKVSKELKAEQLVMLNKLYGYMEKIRYDILHLDYRRAYDPILLDYELLLTELYGDKYSEIKSYDYKMLTIDFLLQELPLEYRELIEKLSILGEINKQNVS